MPNTNTQAADALPGTVRMFIVVYDDNDCLCLPMGWDDDCAGALCSPTGDRVALFASREAARKAIDISAKFAALCRAQGKPANDDFIGTARKNVRVLACHPNNSMNTRQP